ncbi:MAG: hypothetical protein IT338_09275 [Thermomicrobiales bacterium]|nr:hypothetical protein [Thermomicrobiales bacterium]
MDPRRCALITGCTLALLTLATAAPGVAAQGATPVGAPSGPTPRPAQIVGGNCAAPGEIVAPLNDLTRPAGPIVGQAGKAIRVANALTIVPLPLAELLASDDAIVVHLSADQPQTLLACGEIGGALGADGSLVLGLREASASGFTGIAYLVPGIDDASTEISVFVAPVFGAAG